MIGFPEDSGAGKAGLAEGWNRLMLSREVGVEACRKLRPSLLCKAIWPSRDPKRNPEIKAVMHSCYFCRAKPLPVTLAATFHRLLAGERLACSFWMGSQEVGQGRKPWVPYENQFYLAPHWVTEAESV